MPFPGRPRGWARTTQRVLGRDGGICWLCGRPGATSVDHVVPRSKGGGHADANLRAAHITCNSRKGARLAVAQLPRSRPSRW